MPEHEIRKKQIHNLNYLSDFHTEGGEEMPMVQPYYGQLPEDMIPFSERNSNQFDLGVHCYIYDYSFAVTWNEPTKALPCLQKYKCVVVPDYSVFVDMPKAINVWNIYRNRWVSCFWQANGVNVIPSASWGNVDSFDYCFDGLPVGGVISVGHTLKGKDRYYNCLFRMGIETLLEKKRPDVLLVYGEELGFDPGVEVCYYEGIIQKTEEIMKQIDYSNNEQFPLCDKELLEKMEKEYVSEEERVFFETMVYKEVYE